MSYQVLARKWRPRNFQEMVGQEYILRILTNALTQMRIHHAYLFTGTRGVGKTTLARILAKCLNCESGVTATPCGTCAICTSIDAGQFLDLYEVDAASRTKVEDTRELLDNVLYPPTMGRYKIYLIDEVHMLSNHSFNALLKTLEEPPAHVKFLLATTDPKKLPITILSRCLQFHLKRILPEQIHAHLIHICETEKITHESPALLKLAHAADGSMRDALSLLDQAIAFGQGVINQHDVFEMLGSISDEALLPLLSALSKQDGKQLFAHIRALSERAPDFSQLLESMISLFHQLAIAQMIPSLLQDQSLQNLLNEFTPEELQLYYQIALLGRRDLHLTPSHQQGFEMTMLRMLAFKPGSMQIENVKSNPIETPIKKVNPTVAALSETNDKIEAKKAVSESNHWRDILAKLNLSGMAQALAANCVLQKMTDTQVELTLSSQHEPMLNVKLKDRIADALSNFFNRTIDLQIALSNEALDTPSKQVQAENDLKLAEAKKTLLENPHIKNMIAMYDATLEVVTT